MSWTASPWRLRQQNLLNITRGYLTPRSSRLDYLIGKFIIETLYYGRYRVKWVFPSSKQNTFHPWAQSSVLLHQFLLDKTYVKLFCVRFWSENPRQTNRKISEYKFHRKIFIIRLFKRHSKAIFLKVAIIYTACIPVTIQQVSFLCNSDNNV